MTGLPRALNTKWQITSNTHTLSCRLQPRNQKQKLHYPSCSCFRSKAVSFLIFSNNLFSRWTLTRLAVGHWWNIWLVLNNGKYRIVIFQAQIVMSNIQFVFQYLPTPSFYSMFNYHFPLHTCACLIIFMLTTKILRCFFTCNIDAGFYHILAIKLFLNVLI